MSERASVASERDSLIQARRDKAGNEQRVEAESMRSRVWRRFRRHRPALISIGVLAILIVVSFLVPLFVNEEELANRVHFDKMLHGPSLEHPLGFDSVGRNLFWRLVYGGRISLTIGILSALIAVIFGTTVGAIAGYNGGTIADSVLMRFTEALMSIPSLFILIVLGRILGPSVPMILLTMAMLSWMNTARIVRADVLSIRERDFTLAAQALGVPPVRILLNHILPNVVAPIIVTATLRVGRSIIWEASLSFLGLGVQPPTASWGNMLTRAQGYLLDAPWIAFSPGLMILITVLSINFIGDGLRDALDPYALQ